MFNENAMKSMMELFANPLFRQGCFDFAMKMQQEGMEAARKAWNMPKGSPFGSPEEFYAKMEEFSALMGFVSSAKHDELRKENEKLKKENDLLKDMVKELQNNLYKEGAEMAQQSWQNLIEKQMEVNKELAKSFFDQFKDSGRDK
ncbi:MAG: hypothetical protein OEV28_07035 [Nitrospirota bacterium]|nr:hypothetical protein [Nitrospirota bacterium]